MAFAVIQASGSDGGSAGRSSPTADTTGANLVIAPVGVTASSSSTVTDNKSNPTYTNTAMETTSASGYRTLQGYSIITPTVGSGHYTQEAQSFARVGMLAVSGAKSTDHFGGSVASKTAYGADATSLSAGSITPDVDGCLIVTTCCVVGGGAITVPSGFTELYNESGVCAAAYYVQTSAENINPSWSWATTKDAAATVAWFRPEAGGGGGSSNGAAAYYYAQQ